LRCAIIRRLARALRRREPERPPPPSGHGRRAGAFRPPSPVRTLPALPSAPQSWAAHHWCARRQRLLLRSHPPGRCVPRARRLGAELRARAQPRQRREPRLAPTSQPQPGHRAGGLPQYEARLEGTRLGARRLTICREVRPCRSAPPCRTQLRRRSTTRRRSPRSSTSHMRTVCSCGPSPFRRHTPHPVHRRLCRRNGNTLWQCLPRPYSRPSRR